MDTLMAFEMGTFTKHKEQMVFDWTKAAQIIKDQGIKTASAGLRGDWEYTGGYILESGEPAPKKPQKCYFASTWAVPELEADGEIIECYRMQSDTPAWDAHTYWPDEALAILANKALGYVEGDLCNRDRCQGFIETHPTKNCSCFICAPCSSCTGPRNFCPVCDWSEQLDG